VGLLRTVADLHVADLHAADLRAADLRAADLRAADLHAADLHAADLHNQAAAHNQAAGHLYHHTRAAGLDQDLLLLCRQGPCCCRDTAEAPPAPSPAVAAAFPAEAVHLAHLVRPDHPDLDHQDLDHLLLAYASTPALSSRGLDLQALVVPPAWWMNAGVETCRL